MKKGLALLLCLSTSTLFASKVTSFLAGQEIGGESYLRMDRSKDEPEFEFCERKLHSSEVDCEVFQIFSHTDRDSAAPETYEAMSDRENLLRVTVYQDEKEDAFSPPLWKVDWKGVMAERTLRGFPVRTN